MNAEYTTSLLYPGNPYVEALPPMLAGQELIRALASVPPYSDSDRDRSTGERLQLLSALYEFYQPLTMTLDLYCEVYNAMQHCYGQYTPQREASAFQQGYAAMQGKAVAASIGGGNSFSVVGVCTYNSYSFDPIIDTPSVICYYDIGQNNPSKKAEC